MIPGVFAAQASGGAAARWDPMRLASPPQLWMNDESIVPAPGGGTCEQWDDRSGNSNGVTQSLADRQPSILDGELNGRRVLRLDGADDAMFNNGGLRSVFRDVGFSYYFVVYRLRTPGTANRKLVSSQGGTGGNRMSVSASEGVDAPNIVYRRVDNHSTSVHVASRSTAGGWALALFINSWEEGWSRIYLDGSLDSEEPLPSPGKTSDTVGTRAFCLGAEPAGSGANPDANNNADVDVAELLVGNQPFVGVEEIEKLFGYAAHRWGLTSSLPPAHPYKSDPPTV